MLYVSMVRKTHNHNAAFLRAKANKSDPFMYGRSLSELNHNCCAEGTAWQLASDNVAILARKNKELEAKWAAERSQVAEEIKRHLGLV